MSNDELCLHRERLFKRIGTLIEKKNAVLIDDYDKLDAIDRRIDTCKWLVDVIINKQTNCLFDKQTKT